MPMFADVLTEIPDIRMRSAHIWHPGRIPSCADFAERDPNNLKHDLDVLRAD